MPRGVADATDILARQALRVIDFCALVETMRHRPLLSSPDRASYGLALLYAIRHKDNVSRKSPREKIRQGARGSSFLYSQQSNDPLLIVDSTRATELDKLIGQQRGHVIG